MTMTAELPDLAIHLSTPEAVADLVRHLESDERRRPVVIVSPRNNTPDYGLSPRLLAEELAGRAEVYVLDSPAMAHALDAYPKHRTYGGAVRVAGTGGWSIVIRTDLDPEDAHDRVEQMVDRAGKRMAEPAAVRLVARARPCTATPADLARRAAKPTSPEAVSPAETAEVPAAQEPIRTPADAIPPARPDQSAELTRLRAALDEERTSRIAAESGLARAEHDLADAEAEIAPLRRQLVSEQRRRRTAEETVARLRAELSTAQSRAGEADAEHVVLFSDPEMQLRDDLERTWLHAVEEQDRKRYPLRSFRVGPSFIESLDMPLAPRTKILSVVVDVLSKRAYEMSSRSVRPHGDGRCASTVGQMVRADGAVAYRCDIRSNTPAAPRLLWWELTDGTVELALAARHDDPMP